MGSKYENKFQNLSGDVRSIADQVVEYLELNGYTIGFNATRKALRFKKAFKEMSVPVVLVKQAQWSDIRQIYRAVFKPGPQVENFAAPNEWSRALNKVPVEDDGKIVTGSGDKKAERKADKKAEKKAK